MDEVQVFMWFCKENKLNSLIRELYYKINPCHHRLSDGSLIVRETMTFKEYISNAIHREGFVELINRITYDYYRSRGFNDYRALMKRLSISHIRQKWAYFVEHNIFICDECVKIGDSLNVTLLTRSEDVKIEVSSIDIPNCRVLAKDYVNGYFSRSIHFNYIFKTRDDGTYDVKYYIKKKGKLYYGQDKH